MNINILIIYFYIKNCYESAECCFCSCLQKENCEHNCACMQCSTLKPPITPEKDNMSDEPPGEPVFQHMEAVPEPKQPELQSDGMQDWIIRPAANAVLPDIESETVIKNSAQEADLSFKPAANAVLPDIESEHVTNNRAQETDLSLRSATNAALPDTDESVAEEAIQITAQDNPPFEEAGIKRCNQAQSCGLLQYRQWWELVEAEISIAGKIITGIPIFVEGNTLRVINDYDSYFIPLEKVDFIRTKDGLRSSFDLQDDKTT